MVPVNGDVWQRKCRRFKRAGISRRDVLAIVVVLGVGFLFLFPYLFESRMGARRRLCEYRQMSLGRALLRYESHFGEFLWFRANAVE